VKEIMMLAHDAKMTTQTSISQLVQARLDIQARSRTSRLPWRGQFSPELIEYLMDAICADDKVFLDPFCGSGTVLYEAIENGKIAFGLEVNPAAWHLAVLAEFVGINQAEKYEVIFHTKNLLKKLEGDKSRFSTDVLSLITSSNIPPFVRKTLAASLLLAMGNTSELDSTNLSRGISIVQDLIEKLVHNTEKALCMLGDARHTRLDEGTIDAVITSPPYINVFNYHQNYRPAVELLGWKPLEAALSEIGANRKHRSNRFLTVIQYCLDMTLFLDEMARVLKQDGKLILVLGRTSNVLGASFENGHLIKEIIEVTKNFQILQSAERMFINRFGGKIYEDIIVARRVGNITSMLATSQQIGFEALIRARETVPHKNIKLLEDAIIKTGYVLPSPLLNLTIPEIFKD
jgi:DNA modification methylase